MTTISPVPMTAPAPFTSGNAEAAWGRIAARFAPLASLAVPGLGVMLRGRVWTGAVILAGFAASALIPVTAAAVTGMFAFWLWGLTAATEVPGD